MKIPIDKIMRHIKVKELNFDDEVTDLIVNKDNNFSKTNNTIRHSIMYGMSKDLQIQGLKLNNTLIYNLKKMKINVVPEKSLDNIFVGLKIKIIYKLSSKVPFVKSKYVASETHVRFPVLAIYNVEYRGERIPLYPYIVQKYIYAFDTFDEIDVYNSTEEDCMWTNSNNKLEVFFDDANFFIDAMEIILNEEDFIKIIDYNNIGMITYKSLKKKDLQAVNRMDYVVV